MGESNMVLWAARGPRERAYKLLSELLRAEYGLSPLPELARTGRGKPWLPAHPDVHFNLSHSGGLLLCGAGNTPLGVDIEAVRPRRETLVRYVLSPSEYAWYVQQGGRWETLYTLWTLKEARCKCTGEGLRLHPKAIAVPLLRPGLSGKLEGLCFRAYGGAGWRAAACTPEPGALPEHIFWRDGFSPPG